MDLNTAQRTNFKTSMPRLAGKPGQQRQTTQRSANRGQAATPAPGGVLPPATRPMPGKQKPMPPAGMPTRGPGKQNPMPPGSGPMPPGKKPGGGVPPKMPGGVKRPMPQRPGGVVAKPKGDMSMMKKMAAFKPGM